MKLLYELTKQDFLTYQLFTAFHSTRIQKKQKRDWWILTMGSLLFAVYFYYKQITAITIYFVVVAIVFALFYNKYSKWRYEKHYSSFIDDNYQQRFNTPTEIEILDDFILIKDKSGEGKILISEIEEVYNLKAHILAKISTGTTMIIPKLSIDKSEKVLQKFGSFGLTITDHTDWEW